MKKAINVDQILTIDSHAWTNVYARAISPRHH